jgi:hypothetical protein
MKNIPLYASFVRRMCGRKAPFIGVFLFVNLIISQPVFALEQINFTSDTAVQSAFVDAEEQKLSDADSKIDSTKVDLLVDPEIVTDEVVQELSEEQIADLKSLDELLANGELEKEEYDVRKEAILGMAKNQNLGSPLNITGINPKSQTLGKYISPDVSVTDGSLNYVYPISIPPGRGGLNPDLKIVYDSNNTAYNSIIGIGWALNIPYIQRINKKGTDVIYNGNSFISSLDGELIDQGSGIFTPRIENGSFLKYIYGNNTWTVTDKKGTQYQFGITANGKQDNPNDTSKVFTWMLEKVVDANGNTISYTYFKDQGQIYPESISYNQTGVFAIEFSRTPRTYINTSYGAAFKVVTAYRISGINIKVSGILANKYTIFLNDNLVQSVLVEGYQGSQSFSLPPVQFKNFTDEGLKKLSYNSNYKFPIDQATGKVMVLDYNNSTYNGNSFQDINGDGLPDIVRWAANQPNGYSSLTSGNQIFLNTGTGFKLKSEFLFPTDQTTGKVPVFDFKYCFTGQNSSIYYGNSFQDINGDGLPDIVRWTANQPNGYFNPDLSSGNQVFINTGSGFVLDSSYQFPTDENGNVVNLGCNNADSYGNSFQDINGDGLPDIIRWDARQHNGYSSLVSGNQVFINTDSGFMLDLNFLLPTSPTNGNVLTIDYTICKLPQSCSSTVSNLYGNLLMDINGDGLPDIVRWSEGQPNGYYSFPLNNAGNQVFINTGSGFILDSNFLLPTDPSTEKVLVLDYKYGAMSTYYGNSFMDINGDGLIDVVRWLSNQSNGYFNPNYTSGNQVFLNTGIGFTLDSTYQFPTDANGKVIILDYNYNIYYGNSFQDINGDDLPDIVRWNSSQTNGYSSLSSGNQVFINTGSGFILDSNFLLPTATNGKVLTLDFTTCKLPQICISPPSVFYGNSFMDINGDGLIDVVRWDNSQSNGAPSNTTRGNQIFLNEVGRKAIKRIISSSGG